MVEPTAPALSGDELRLAQLACVRLLGLLQGAVSIGLPALVTGTPEPRTFLQDRFRVLTAFALVLHTTSSPAANVHEVLRLRERSGKLLSLLEDLRRQLFAALDSSEPIPSSLRPAQLTASALFDSAGEYAGLIQLDGAPIEKAKAAVMQVFEVMGDFDPSHAPSAR